MTQQFGLLSESRHFWAHFNIILFFKPHFVNLTFQRRTDQQWLSWANQG